MKPGTLAKLLVVVGVTCMVAAIGLPRIREAAFVLGLFFVFLAGGVLNWDRRSGH
jgi:hypothetical protein